MHMILMHLDIQITHKCALVLHEGLVLGSTYLGFFPEFLFDYSVPGCFSVPLSDTLLSDRRARNSYHGHSGGKLDSSVAVCKQLP